MASPQIENGHLRIANELIEAILAADLGRREQKVVWAVIRKTYGFNKKADAISTSQIAALTRIDRSDVAKTIRGLIQKQVLLSAESSVFRHGMNVPALSVNKDYESWQTVGKTPAGPAGKSPPVGDSPTGGKSPAGTGGKTPAGPAGKSPTTKDSKDRKTGDARTRAGTSKNGVPCPREVTPAIWSDFLAHRRAKRAPLTATAWERMRPQVEMIVQEYGWTFDDVLAEVQAAGWQGCRADWMRKRIEQERQASGNGSGGGQEWWRGLSESQ